LSGYDCVAVPDGQGGLELARRELFDLIVLDLFDAGARRHQRPAAPFAATQRIRKPRS
jgi:CheY-like chemotaxis protein